MQTLTLTLPRPHPAQQQIKRERSRFNVLALGRRSGKTVLGIDLCVEPDVLAHPVAWYAPTYKDMLEVWREAVAMLAPITLRVNASERRIENVAGGVLEFWSADNPNAGRGRMYKRVILDECAFIPRLTDLWYFAIRPTLVDFEGDAYFLSTPKGRNGFWQMYQNGLDDEMSEWACWQMPSSCNPFLPASELDAMRKTMPERVYQQEILAEFIEDAGGVFRGVMLAATATGQAEALHGHNYVFGVDWGKHADFTVITVIDVDTAELVAMDRFNQIDYTVQTDRLKSLARRFKPAQIIAEKNSIGEPLIEILQRDGLPIAPFTTTNATKQMAIDSLVVAFERGDLRIINDPILIGELQAFETSRTPSGMLKYSAPEGMHDDTVMSLALAWQGAAASGPLLIW